MSSSIKVNGEMLSLGSQTESLVRAYGFCLLHHKTIRKDKMRKLRTWLEVHAVSKVTPGKELLLKFFDEGDGNEQLFAAIGKDEKGDAVMLDFRKHNELEMWYRVKQLEALKEPAEPLPDDGTCTAEDMRELRHIVEQLYRSGLDDLDQHYLDLTHDEHEELVARAINYVARFNRRQAVWYSDKVSSGKVKDIFLLYRGKDGGAWIWECEGKPKDILEHPEIKEVIASRKIDRARAGSYLAEIMQERNCLLGVK